MGDIDRLKGAESKVDIITPDKTNKTLILVCYKLSIQLFIKTYNIEKKMSRSTICK